MTYNSTIIRLSFVGVNAFMRQIYGYISSINYLMRYFIGITISGCYTC